MGRELLKCNGCDVYANVLIYFHNFTDYFENFKRYFNFSAWSIKINNNLVNQSLIYDTIK